MALGKSLDNILGDYFGEEMVSLQETKQLELAKTVVEEIQLVDIQLSPFQTRRYFDPEKLKTLAESIRVSGLIHPIIVLKKSKVEEGQQPYMLIAGERRLRAIRDVLELNSIIAVVKEEDQLTDAQHAMLTAMENLQREDLNPIELANTFVMLMQTQDIDETGVALMLEHSEQYVKNYLRLLGLVEPVRIALERKDIGEGQARHLVGLTEDEQLQMLQLIIQKDLTVREIVEILKRKDSKPLEDNRFLNNSHNLSFDYYRKAEKLAAYFPNSKLKCSGDDEKGKIVISWG